MKDFWLCFVPLFVAVDAIGVLPMFINLTQDLETDRVRRVIIQSVVTAAVVALSFLVVGTAVFNLLGVSVADFMVAGGVLLFILSVVDLLTVEKTQRRVDPESLGVVPLGVPLIAGPAVLTTSVLLMNEHGVVPTASAIMVNLLIAGVIFHFAQSTYKFLGKVGAKAISKVSSLLLAAIAVMMIRKGIASFLQDRLVQ